MIAVSTREEAEDMARESGGTAFCRMDTPLGTVRIEANDQGITSLQFVDEPFEVPDAPDNQWLRAAAAQLQEYFQGARRRFDLPLLPSGTDFQRKVWRALAEIPYGETRSYTQVAGASGHPNAARAVGAACGRNPMLILIPCHRALGANGSLTGFAAGLARKRGLLALERQEA